MNKSDSKLLQEIAKQFLPLNEKVDNLVEKVDNLTGAVKCIPGLVEKVDNLTGTIGRISERLDDLNDKVDNIDKKMYRLELSNSSVIKGVVQLQVDMSDIKENYASKEDFRNLLSSVEAIAGNHLKLENENDFLKIGFQRHDSDITKLKLKAGIR